VTFEEKIARVCHAANQGLQAAYPAEGVPVAPPWDGLDAETQEGIVAGVCGILAGNTPEESHQAWCEFKLASGWTYGPRKIDADGVREHPCLVPYDELPFEHVIKDHLFAAVVQTLAAGTIDCGPSVVERIADLEQAIRAKQTEGWGDPRELALSLTALEDCQMRFTRGRAKASGVFKPVDLERVEARAERERFEAEAGAAAEDPS
jgi:hypothetical protein